MRIIILLGLIFGIIQQPTGDIGWVSDGDGFTEFQQPLERYGTLAYLAHGDKAGQYLFSLEIGDVITWVDYSPTSIDIRRFEVVEIKRYKAVQPTNIYSDLIDLDTGKRYWVGDVTDKLIYNDNSRIVFQTCIEKDGDPNYGRLYIIAEKIQG